MDSDKENANLSRSDSFSTSCSESSLQPTVTAPEEPNSSTSETVEKLDFEASSSTQLLPETIDYSNAPLTEHEIYLAENLPELAALVERMKLAGAVGNIGDDLLEPTLMRLENQTSIYENVREQAEDTERQAKELLEEYSNIRKSLEEELKPLLEVFGLGLPTEAWHVDAIRAAIMEKCKNPSGPAGNKTVSFV